MIWFGPARRSLLGTLILLLCAATGSTAAPEPGTVFVFDDRRIERFVRAEGDQYLWSTNRGRQYRRPANPALPLPEWTIGDRSDQRATHGLVDWEWPPVSGDQVRFTVVTDSSRADRVRRTLQAWHCQVGESEWVEVPAGQYLAQPVSCQRYSVHTMRPLQQRVWWWSNEVGHYVRREYHNLRTGQKTVRRLCAALPAQRANPVRLRTLREDCQRTDG